MSATSAPAGTAVADTEPVRRRAAHAEGQSRNYYGEPILQIPVWNASIAWHFFCGGLAGASSVLGLAARLAGNDRLARSAWLAAMAGLAPSPPLLIADLGRPERFYNMLRVFKPTSPMSVGSWILTGAGAGIAGAFGAERLPIARRLGPSAEALAGVFGLGLASYTAVLVADTAVPAWHEARRELPFVFVGSAAASAGGAAAVLTPVAQAGPARRMAVAGATLEQVAVRLMERRLGTLAEPYRSGSAHRYALPAKAATSAGALLLGSVGGTPPRGRGDRRGRAPGRIAARAVRGLPRRHRLGSRPSLHGRAPARAPRPPTGLAPSNARFESTSGGATTWPMPSRTSQR